MQLLFMTSIPILVPTKSVNLSLSSPRNNAHSYRYDEFSYFKALKEVKKGMGRKPERPACLGAFVSGLDLYTGASEESVSQGLIRCIAFPIVVYLSAIYANRPRGSARSDLLVVETSHVPGAGRGVFARQTIPAKTVLGEYPGRPRKDIEMAAKCMLAPMARQYCFLSSTVLLDPTDETGLPSTRPSPGLWWPFEVDVTLSLVNEPPKDASLGTNVCVEDDPKDPDGLLFVADREIMAGEELFIDYGRDYDRSGYYDTKLD